MEKELKELSLKLAENYLAEANYGKTDEYLVADAKTMIELVEKADAREASDDIKRRELDLERDRLEVEKTKIGLEKVKIEAETERERKKSRNGLILGIIGAAGTAITASGMVAAALIKAKADANHDSVVVGMAEDLIKAEQEGGNFVGFSGKVVSGAIK